MSMTDVDMEEFPGAAEFLFQEGRRSTARTLAALDDDPEAAARAQQLSRASGEDPALVYPFLEEKEKQFKATLTSDLLSNNKFLRQYIDAHPLANKVSNDDYGQLDAVTEAAGKLPGYRKFAYTLATGIENSIGLTAEGLGYLFGVEGTKGAAERMKAKTLSDVSADKKQEKEFKEFEGTIPGMVGSGIGGFVGMAPSVIAGGLPGIGIQMGLVGGAEARNRAAAIGADEQTQANAFTAGFAINSILGVAPLHLLQRPAQAGAPGVMSWSTAKLKDALTFAGIFTGFSELQHGFNEWAARLLYDPKAAYHPDFNRVASTFILGGMMGATFNRVKPYVEAGEEIPPGAHPIVDQAKAKQAEVDIDNLEAALKEASKSATRERSPELFKLFMQQHTDAKIGVSADAIVKMYGDKEPVIDDNKLGWVPNIKEQLAVARETGGDVEIPLADWLAHVDPALAKELHDDVRVRPKGLTIREADSLPELHQGPSTGAKQFAALKENRKQQEELGRQANEANDVGNIKERDRLFDEIDRLKAEAKSIEAELDTVARKGTALEAVPMVEAWHGGPHQFDAFSLDKIGTGEGAQSYGHGLYFAENRKVAEEYKNVHKRTAAWTSTGDAWKDLPEGNLYRVRIHAEKDQFLDWDATLDKQSPYVKGVLDKQLAKQLQEMEAELAWVKENPDAAEAKYNTDYVKLKSRLENNLEAVREGAISERSGVSGQTYYRRMHSIRDPKEASDALREAGIPGIRYLDQGSRHIEMPVEMLERWQDLKEEYWEFQKRGTENLSKEEMDRATIVEKEIKAVEKEFEAYKESQKTYNYVIFDERLIEIVDRNGEAINAVREQAGLKPLARKELWTEERLEQAADALEGEIIERGPGIKTVEAKGELTQPEMEAVAKANEVLERILPDVEKVGARLITQDGKGGIQGMFQQYTDRIPTIMYLMDPKKAVHTVRHEAIHFLRREGFFTKEEWNTLREVAIKDGWIEHYDIAQRYPKENIGRMLEEAVAERYADWGEGNKYGKPEVDGIFQKIKNLAVRVIQVVKEALPHNVTVEEIFQKIESGEIGQRTGTKPLDKLAYRAEQKMEPEAEAAQRDLFAKANAIGMTVPQFERYMRLIKKRGEEDIKAQMERAEAFERKKQTKEWKESEARIRDEVTSDIQFRPDIAAATFFTEGRLYDTIKNQSPKLSADLVPEEFAGRLPKELLVKKGGINPDDIAPLFGYQTGREMISKLAEMNEARGELPFKEFVKGIVDDEVSVRMLREHGMLEENILKAAQEHVIGDTQMDLLHEEFLGLGMKSKLLQNPFTKDQIKAWAANAFDQLPIANIKLDRFLSEAGKAGREAEMKLLIGKVEDAFQQKQRQYVAMLMAREAKALEKEQAQFDKTAKRFSSRKIENVEQSYTDYVQALLSLAGLKVRRSDKEIAESIQAFGTGSLEAFVQRKEREGWDLAVSDNVQQRNIKQIEQMNVAEFREFKEAIDSLVHIGREEKKIIVGEAKRDFDEVKKEIIENIVQLPERSKKNPTRLLYSLDASLVKMEEMAKDLDLRKQAGPMFKALILPLVHSKRRENDMLKKLTTELAEIKGFAKDWKKTLDDSIPNDFLIDPRGDVPFDLTRQTMINIMLNFGNRSNIQKFTEGYAGKKEAGKLEARLWQLFDQHATKEDWQFVQKIWDLFETWRGESDAMYRRISGVPPKWIEVEPVQTRHGEFKGGYFPILYDKLRSNAAVIEDKAIAATSTFGSNYVKATTGAGYAKARTGYIDYVLFENSIEQVAGRMQQMIHDISHREAVMSVGKLIYDREIRAALRKHYGPEYESQLHPWLRDVANNYNANEPAIGFWNNLLSRARGNLVIHALGFNARVILSPNLGMFNPAQATKFYSDYRFNRDMVMSKSEEIPHTLRNLDRDFHQKLQSTVKKNGWNEFQAKAFEVSMWPALQLEQQARMIGFYTRYNRAIKKGLSEADAVAEADNAVRSFHGAAGTIDLPAVMRGGEFQKIATVFYGFFNTMYNWQRQMPGQLKRGEFIDAYKTLYGSVLIPAAFGALLFNQAKESDSWFKTISKALALQPLSTVPIIREAASYFAEGFPPRSPIESVINAAGAIVSDVKKWQKGERVKKPIQHGANVIGLTAGLPLAQIGRTSQFISDVSRREQRPRNVQEWVRGVISGEARLKP